MKILSTFHNDPVLKKCLTSNKIFNFQAIPPVLGRFECCQNFKSTLQWRHNERDGVSNHQRIDCLLNCIFRRRSMKTSKLRVTGLVGEFNSPHKDPVTRKMFPFDDVIMEKCAQNCDTCASELGHHRLSKWFVARLASSNYLKLYWLSFNWNTGNKLMWNLHKNTERSFAKCM